MSTEGHESSLAHRGQRGDPNEVAIRYVAVDVLSQVRSHVGGHVAEAVEGAKCEVEDKAAKESQEAIKFLSGK